MRVLLCDDHVVFAESLAHLLGQRGAEVVATTFHPRDALAVLEDETVDICLLDVMFGAETVLDTLADIRRAAPRSAVVLLSGQVDSHILTDRRALGVHGIADKRLPVADIVNILERVHRGEKVRPNVTTVAPTPRTPCGTAAGHALRMAAFLTPRERQVLGALVCGQDTRRLARELGISATTARCHIQSVLVKLGMHSRLEAATNAVRFGMVDPENGQWMLPIV